VVARYTALDNMPRALHALLAKVIGLNYQEIRGVSGPSTQYAKKADLGTEMPAITGHCGRVTAWAGSSKHR
jgi:hypothetical protein